MQPHNHLQVMLDLETWSLSNNARIVSIGATKFLPFGHGMVEDRFHIAINPERGIGDIAPSTVLWWMSPQRDAARAKWWSLEKFSIQEALAAFDEWFGPDPLPVWGNGAAFDNVVLRNSFDVCGMRAPWSYKDDRCYRTIIAHMPKDTREMPGTAHDALDDAVYQTQRLQKAFAHYDLKAE